MLQAKASGQAGDIFDMRRIIADSVSIKRFDPQDHDLWDKAYGRYLEVTGKQ